MIFATLEQAEFYRDKATILKDIDPKSTDLTKMDSIKIVEDYIYNDKLDILYIYIVYQDFLIFY